MDDKIEKLGELVIKLHVYLEDKERTDRKIDDFITQILILQQEIEDENYLINS